jgi:Tfp pilus assembly protein PilP
MKLTTGILAVGLMTGGLWAQNPNIINNVQNTMNTVQQKKTSDSNAALGITATPSANPAAKPAAGAPAKAAAIVPVSLPVTPAVKSAPAPVKPVAKPKETAAAKKTVPSHPVIAAKETASKVAAKTVSVPTKISLDDKAVEAAKIAEAPKTPKTEEKKWAMSGKRDPFFSPIVQQPSGSGCSSGKKCLEIGQINVRGVVKSENGFIAVVTNSLNKAYFLRENDPVFNGYVVRITGDTVVFQETVQDKLGKSLTREVVKKITTPAV